MSEKTFCAHDLAQALESWADPAFAESYDNVGLQVGSATQIVRRVLIALDLTSGVVEEAIQKECSMILTHHPLLFRSPSRILEEDFIRSANPSPSSKKYYPLQYPYESGRGSWGCFHRSGRNPGPTSPNIPKPE